MIDVELAHLDQPMPTPNGSQPVIDQAHDLLESRRELGRQRYKTPLQTNNGRDFGRDADEEMADWFIYWVGYRAEQRQRTVALRDILSSIEDATRTAGTDYGLPHVAKLARQAIQLLHAGPAADREELDARSQQASLKESTSRVTAWMESRLGKLAMSRKERAMRLLEEALELAQVEGVSFIEAGCARHYVYSHKPGDPRKEAGDCAVTLLAYCAAGGFDLCELAAETITMLEGVPQEKIDASVKRKREAGLLTYNPEG